MVQRRNVPRGGGDIQAQWRDVDTDPSESASLLDSHSTSRSASESSLSDHGDRPLPSIERERTWNGFDDFEGMPWWQTPSVYWLLFPYAVFTLAFGGIIVPKLNLILSLVCRRYFADQTIADTAHAFSPVVLGGDNPQCRIPEVQSLVAEFMLYLSFCTGLLSALIAPKLGHMSDRYGRLRLMALSSCGGLIGELITVLAAKFPDTVDYRWLILGSIFDGMTGSFTAGSILSMSYTSDCTPPSKRAVSVGYVQACLFGGLAFGPLLAGYFVEWTGSLLSIFYVVLGCHTFFILFVGFVVPESLSKQKRRAAREKWDREKEARVVNSGSWISSIQSANPFVPLKILWPMGPGTSRRLRLNLVALAVCDMIIMSSGMAAGPSIILYAGATFGWGTLEGSQFISALSLVRVFILLGLLPAINYIFRTWPAARRRRRTGQVVGDRNSGADLLDIWILRVALISDLLGCIGYIFARSPALFFLSGMTTALGGLGSATTGAVVTKHVPQDRVGQILGAVGMMHAIARVVGPVAFNGLYAMTTKSFKQAIFVLLASLFVVALAASLFVRPRVHWEEEAEDIEPEVPGQQDPVLSTSVQTPLIDEDQVPA